MKKNILILDTGKEWGGGTNSLLELLKRIDRNKYNFSVLFYYNYKKDIESDIKTEIEKLGIKFLLLEQKAQPVPAKVAKELSRLIFFFSRRLKKYLIFLIDYHFRIKGNAKKISGILKDLRADLLYMNNQPSSNLEGIIASKTAGVPALQHSRIETTLNSFEIKAVNQWLKKMICVSEGVRDNSIRQGIDKSKCVVVYNGIDTETLPGMSNQDIKRKWGIPDGDILIGTVGSLLKRKRIKDLVEAFSLVINKTKCPVKCMIIGEGTERESLMAKVIEKNLVGSVIFTGFQTDAVSHVNAMDIFVMPSEKEGLPRVILEAMLMGKPVVASAVTGSSELVVDGKTGFLVPLGKSNAFADAILKLIDDSALKAKMGEAARERVIKNFPIKKYVEDVEKVFVEVLGH